MCLSRWGAHSRTHKYRHGVWVCVCVCEREREREREREIAKEGGETDRHQEEKSGRDAPLTRGMGKKTRINRSALSCAFGGTTHA
jgi:hypothetical protein